MCAALRADSEPYQTLCGPSAVRAAGAVKRRSSFPIFSSNSSFNLFDSTHREVDARLTGHYQQRLLLSDFTR